MAGDAFDSLVSRTYDAALDPGGWPGVLRHLRRETGAVAGGILQNTWSHEFSRGHFVQGINPNAIEDYRSYYRNHIPWINVPELFRPGITRTDRTIDRYYNDSHAFIATEYCNDWMKPQGFRHIMRAVVHGNDNECVSVFLFGEAGLGGFEGRSQTLFQRLVPHLMRATEIQRRLEDLDVTASAITSAIDQLTTGVIYIDENGVILGVNKTADAMLTKGDGVVSIGGKVAPARTSDGPAFSRAFQQALPRTKDEDGGSPPAPATVSLSRPSDRLPLVATLVPAAKDSLLFAFGQTAAVLLIADPLARPATAEDTLIAVFGLTRSEARLATALVGRGRLKDAAEAVGITYETARSYLKIIFHKTGTGRQVELVRLLVASGS